MSGGKFTESVVEQAALAWWTAERFLTWSGRACGSLPGAQSAKKRRERIVPWSADRNQWCYQAVEVLERLTEAWPDISPGRIRWDAFRHTFGSLLAQGGVSLVKISAWMGNSPQVCRRHYAEFVPIDTLDQDVDRL